MQQKQNTIEIELTAPPHPYWCDDCGQKAPFTIPGCPIEHSRDCERYNEKPMSVYEKAVNYCRTTGKPIH